MNKIYCSAAVLLFSAMTAFTAENNNDKMKNGSFEIISEFLAEVVKLKTDFHFY